MAHYTVHDMAYGMMHVVCGTANDMAWLMAQCMAVYGTAHGTRLPSQSWHGSWHHAWQGMAHYTARGGIIIHGKF